MAHNISNSSDVSPHPGFWPSFLAVTSVCLALVAYRLYIHIRAEKTANREVIEARAALRKAEEEEASVQAAPAPKKAASAQQYNAYLASARSASAERLPQQGAAEQNTSNLVGTPSRRNKISL